MQQKLADKDTEITKLKTDSELNLAKKLAEKESTIIELKNKNDKAEIEKKLSVAEAVQKIEKERDSLANDLKNKDTEKSVFFSRFFEIVLYNSICKYPSMILYMAMWRNR